MLPIPARPVSSTSGTQLSKIRDCLSPADTEKLVQASITSNLDSGNSLLYGLPTFLIDRLQNVQNAAARIITRTKKYNHIKPVLEQLQWLAGNQRFNYTKDTTSDL